MQNLEVQTILYRGRSKQAELNRPKYGKGITYPCHRLTNPSKPGKDQFFEFFVVKHHTNDLKISKIFKRDPLRFFSKICLAYRGFFTKTALARDRKFAKWWMESSEAFRQLLDDHEEIRNNIDQIDDGSNIDIMTFEQFLEAILIHLENTEKAKYRRRWSESGEDHISLS